MKLSSAQFILCVLAFVAFTLVAFPFFATFAATVSAYVTLVPFGLACLAANCLVRYLPASIIKKQN